MEDYSRKGAKSLIPLAPRIRPKTHVVQADSILSKMGSWRVVIMLVGSVVAYCNDGDCCLEKGDDFLKRDVKGDVNEELKPRR